MSHIMPAGHGTGVASKTYAAEPVSDLEKAFHNWPEHETMMRFRSFEADDLHQLILKYPDHPGARVSNFLNVGYNRCRDRVIVSDMDLNMDYVGRMLSLDKLLISKGTTGSFLGEECAGVIVNYGKTGIGAGFRSTGAIIRAGNEKRPSLFSAPSNHCGQEISVRTWIPYHSMSGRLQRYIIELVEVCKGPIDLVYERYGAIPSKAIKDDIRMGGWP